MAISIITILYNALTLHLISVILGPIFAIIGFLFIGWWLGKIGEAEGTRIVIGKSLGRHVSDHPNLRQNG